MNKLNKKGKIVLIAIAVCGCAIILSVTLYFRGISSVSSEDKEVIVDIPSGSSGNKVIDILDEHGLIKDKFMAKIFLKLHHYDFKSNAYALNENMDLPTMLDIIEKADNQYVANIKITVLDGETIPDYADRIAKATGLMTEDILATWENQDFLKKLIQDYWFLSEDILQSDIYFPLEGYLAPDTYIITNADNNIEAITRLMLDQSDKILSKYKKEIQSFQINGQSCSVHEFMTLASIVQRESPSEADDQKNIAGVLMNRLALPMRLQSDVTVNYANQVTKVAVTYKDLTNDSKYNTYRYEGLPIGPISSVSSKVIDHTLNYTTNDNYFFFATKEGKVIYSKTYEEHQKVVKENKWY